MGIREILECNNCAQTGWVCENHPNFPWAGLTGGEECCGGAGAPCQQCNPHGETGPAFISVADVAPPEDELP